MQTTATKLFTLLSLKCSVTSKLNQLVVSQLVDRKLKEKDAISPCWQECPSRPGAQ